MQTKFAVTDVRDDLSAARMKTTCASLIAPIAAYIPVANEEEAGLALVSQIGSLFERPGIGLINAAPRCGTKAQWDNGIPFGSVQVEKTLLIGTINPGIYQLLCKVLRIERLNFIVYDIKKVVPLLKTIPTAWQDYVINSQYRGADFLPHLTAALLAGQTLPADSVVMDIKNLDHRIVFADRSGEKLCNLKTNILPSEVGFMGEGIAEVRIESGGTYKVTCHKRLGDVHTGQPALIIGSTGIGPYRLLELVVGQGDAAAFFGITKTPHDITLTVL